MAVSLEELGAFLHSPVPRAVPQNIRRKKLSGVLGCGLYVIGIFFGGFGSIFLAIFFPWRMVQELSLDWGHPAVADGTVTSSEQTSMSIGGGDHDPGKPVHRIRYQYQPPQQPPLSGVCYRTGEGMAVGQAVKVQHHPWGASFSRIEGCRVNPFGYWTIFVALFPLVGFSVAGLQWRWRRRALRLLRDGTFALGKITAVDKTNVEVNDQPRYKITVAFDVDGQPQTTQYNAYGDEVALAQRKLAAAEEVGLLYSPTDPRHVLLVDSLLAE